MNKNNNQNKFGMFIHWGVYSMWALQEQAIIRFDMDATEYEKKALEFNPTEYDPEKWVIAAKNAGIKYICFTTKHHDGFCMWDTKYTDYNIMNTTYGKDVLKMLAEACQKHGMLLSLYYSCPDWNYAYGYNPNSTHQWLAKNKKSPEVSRYIEYVKNQITELLSNYGKIYTLFWDIPPKINDESVNELVRRLQPGIFINNRGFDEGDFSTPERYYAETPNCMRFEHMTEACDSVGEQSWGYRENEDYHTVRYLTTSIDRIMSMGGSYLLNVGPKADGTINEKSAELLQQVGDWYKRMEGCLEETEEDDFEYEIKKYNFKVNRKNGKSYFHFYEGITSSAVAFKKYPSMPKCVRLMNTHEELEFGETLLPEYFNGETGQADGKHLHIFGIPTDALQSEPIVIEIEW